LSYFAKPNFIVYDEWFDNDFKKTKLDFKNKKITNSSKIHEFFYEQSNYKVGASENNLRIDIDENREELFNNYYFEKNSEKYDSLSNKKFLILKTSKCWVWFKGSLNNGGYWKEGFTCTFDENPGVLIESPAYITCRVPTWRVVTKEPENLYKSPLIPDKAIWKII